MASGTIPKEGMDAASPERHARQDKVFLALKARCSTAQGEGRAARSRERPEPWVENEKGISPERAKQKTCSALSGLVLILL